MNGHSIRGTGFYLSHLKRALIQYFPDNTYHFFSTEKELPKNVDLIHFPYFDPFFLTLPLWKRYKTVVTVHDLTPLVFPNDFPIGIKGFLKWQLQKFNLKQVDAIITDSESSQKDIARICGISEKKIHVVYLAAGERFKQIGKHQLESIKKKYNLPEKFVLYVGDATPNKNLPRFLQAIEKLQIPLIMVGKSLADRSINKENPWNKDLVTVQHMNENNPLIKLVGFVADDELVALYNLATVFVMPSLYEGFGLPILEAMASGCPVVCSNAGSLKEVAGDAACFVDPYDSSAIAVGIDKVYKDVSLQKELTAKGLEHVKKFTWKKTGEETVDIYQSIL